jgi:hypothetical protein
LIDSIIKIIKINRALALTSNNKKPKIFFFIIKKNKTVVR